MGGKDGRALKKQRYKKGNKGQLGKRPKLTPNLEQASQSNTDTVITTQPIFDEEPDEIDIK
eukprot:Pgem_evm2s2457